MRSSYLVGPGDAYGRVATQLKTLDAFETDDRYLRTQLPTDEGFAFWISITTFDEAAQFRDPESISAVWETVIDAGEAPVTAAYMECSRHHFIASIMAQLSRMGAAPFWLWDDDDVLWPAEAIDPDRLFLG